MQRVQLWLAVAALIALMMVTVVDVFMRYSFNRPVRGSFDAVEGLLLLAATLFSTSRCWLIVVL